MNSEQATAQILGALRAKHDGYGWACFEELALIGPHFRRIDLYAVGCWGSHGFRAIAYEVKASRADFAHELEDPSKRQAAFDYSHEAWFATPPGVVKPGEVPDGWGHLELGTDGTLRKRTIAQQRNLSELPLWMVASIARRCAHRDGNDGAKKAKLYRARGRDLSEDELVALCKEVAVEEIYAARSELRRAQANAAERLEMDALKRAINKLCGYGVGETAEAFERWFEGEQRRNVRGVSEPLARVANALVGVKDTLDALLMEVDA